MSSSTNTHTPELKNHREPKSVVILHGTNYWNIGDLGLMVATIQSLKTQFPAAQLTVLTQFGAVNRPSGQAFDIQDLGVEELCWMTTPVAAWLKKIRGPLLILKAIYNAILICLLRLPMLSWLRRIPTQSIQSIDRMLGADVIVSKPGGFFYGYSKVPGPHHMLHFFLASLCRRPLVIYGQSIGPFSENVNLPLVRRVLDRATAILVRDERSRQICLQDLALNPNKIVLTADEAFRFHGSAKEIQQESDDRSRPLQVGLTLINWHFPGQADPDQIRQRYLDAMRTLVRHMFDHHGAAVNLFTFLRASATAPGDEAVTQEFYASVKDYGDIDVMLPNDPMHVKDKMQSVDVFVGSRMHSNIFALGEGIPVLAIAYQHKTTSIMSMAGLSEYVLDINTLDPDELCQRFDALVEHRLQLRGVVRDAVADISARAQQNAILTRSIAMGTSVETLSASTASELINAVI